MRFTILILLFTFLLRLSAQVNQAHLKGTTANVQTQIDARALISGTNSLSSSLIWDGNSTNSIEFSDLSAFTVSPSSGSFLSGNFYLTNSPTAYIAATNTLIEARSSLKLYTPAVAAGTAVGGQFLSLTDDANGEVEFATVSSFSPGSDLGTAIDSIGAGNNVAITSGKTLLDFSGTGTITGFSITGQPDGKVIAIYVRSGTLTLENESASSTAENRIVTGQARIIARAGSMVTLCLVRNGAGIRRWAILGTSTPPIFTSTSDIEPSSQSGYVDTVVRGAGQDFSFKKSQTLTGISSTQNNLAIDSDNTVVNMSSTGSAQTITGFANGAEGRVVIVRVLLSASFGVVLAHNSGSSLAANRFLSITGANVTIPPGGAVMMIYGTGGWYILN